MDVWLQCISNSESGDVLIIPHPKVNYIIHASVVTPYAFFSFSNINECVKVFAHKSAMQVLLWISHTQNISSLLCHLQKKQKCHSNALLYTLLTMHSNMYIMLR